ncbi:MAG: hypothetical protein PHU64_03940 [Candidatus Omnitrophica bacterium]|nr:hypothetical protein [Candidatus Omnitrophota bacterium]MDD5429303.1 hypothetical protein [Candidatus Omnitrophota bacterium]
MNKKYGIVYTVFGKKAAEDCVQCIASVRRYCDYPIKILSDHLFDVDAINVAIEIVQPIDYEKRWGHRNSDYFRLIALRDSVWDVTLYIDNDYLVVNSAFLDGFEIAKNFGMVIPINTRVFLKTDLDIGKDVSEEDRKELIHAPVFAPSFDCAVVFYSNRSSKLLLDWIRCMEERPCRGPVALWRAIWRTKEYPFGLPFNWRVTRKHVGVIDIPIILHVGDKEVKDFYQSHLPLYIWKIIWSLERFYERQDKRCKKYKGYLFWLIKKCTAMLSQHS